MNSDEHSILPFERHHRDSLLSFRAAHYGQDSLRAHPGYVDWLFLDAYQSKPDRPALFICEEDQRIVGTQGLLHVNLQVGAEQLPAAWVADFAVLREFQRSRGVGSAIARASRKAMKVRLALDVSHAAVGMALRDGWQHICDVPLWIRPLNAPLAAQRKKPWLTRTGVPMLAQAALDALLRRGLRSAQRRTLELVPSDAFDARADSLWTAIAPSYPVMCERSSEYLRWRFDRFPAKDSYRRFWLKRDGVIAGYAVLRIGMHKDVPALFLVDYFCAPDLASSLVALALEIGRDAGAAIAYCLTLHPEANAIFRPLGFLRRRSGWPFMAYTKEAPASTATLMANAANWFITAGDSNVDHLRALAQSNARAVDGS